MPHSVDSSSNANSRSSDVPTVSTAPSSTGANNPSTRSVHEAEAEQSPGLTGFIFDDITTVHLPSASASSQKKLRDRRATSPRMATQLNGLGPQPTVMMTEQEKQEYQKHQEYQRRLRHFEDKFAYKSDHITLAVENIMKESPVIAELRTNVIIKDEFTLITSLSAELSTRYSRAESSIMVTLSHSSCLMIGGTFDPAYMLTISAMPEYIQGPLNEHNTILIQRFMTDILSVPANRGIIRFVALQDDMIGTRGTTIRGHMQNTDPSLLRSLTSRSARRRSTTGDKRKSVIAQDGMNRKASTKSVKSMKEQGKISPPIPIKTGSLEPTSSFTRASANAGRSRPASTNGAPTGFGLSINGTTPMAHQSPAPTTRPSSARKSILKMTGQSDTNLVVPPPPPVPEDVPSSKIYKRKSFVSMFKREKAA